MVQYARDDDGTSVHGRHGPRQGGAQLPGYQTSWVQLEQPGSGRQ